LGPRRDFAANFTMKIGFLRSISASLKVKEGGCGGTRLNIKLKNMI
jgi:hypothetical protein